MAGVFSPGLPDVLLSFELLGGEWTHAAADVGVYLRPCGLQDPPRHPPAPQPAHSSLDGETSAHREPVPTQQTCSVEKGEATKQGHSMGCLLQ